MRIKTEGEMNSAALLEYTVTKRRNRAPKNLGSELTSGDSKAKFLAVSVLC